MSDAETPGYRTLSPRQIARVHVHDVTTGNDVVVHEDSGVLLEAPNWTASGSLLLNGEGVLWSLEPVAGARPVRLEHDDLPPVNNDHVLDPDGEHVFLSAMDGHIHRAAIAGGPARKITSEDGIWHFLHGVSPDGATLAFVQMRSFTEPGRLALIGAAGGPVDVLDTGRGHIDGPEWTPDGEWILFNTERWAVRPGHAQLARVPSGGGEVERLHSSDTVDWFPHVSPDGRFGVYIEFPTGTEGHPADRPVTLIVVRPEDWSTPLERIPLPGGQGTINVGSWSPDSTRFAYVSYPTTD